MLMRFRLRTPFPRRALLMSLIICAGGSFHFGYQLTVLNPSEWIFRQFINESSFDHYGQFMDETTYRIVWSFVLNCLAIGCLLGTLPLVRLSETLGRRKTFYTSSGFVSAGLLLQALSKPSFLFELLAAGRLLVGFGTGLALGLEPMYFNEISPIDRRGFMCSMTGIFVELGFFMGGLAAIPSTLGTTSLWPVMFAAEMIPTVLFLLLLPFTYDSPRYLLSRGKIGDCKRSLTFFGHTDIGASMREIETEIQCQREQATIKEIWQKLHLRRAAILGTLVALMTPASGIIAIDFFSTSIFLDVGLSSLGAQYASLGVFLQCFISAILGGFIVDKVGRRSLLLVTTGGLVLSNTALMTLTIAYDAYGIISLGYLNIAACVVLSLAFGVGPSILQWTVASELVPQNARSSVQLVAMTVQKIALIITGMAFFPLQGAIGAYSFLIFIVPLSLCLVIFVWKFPETKNKSVVEILHILGYASADDSERQNKKRSDYIQIGTDG